MRGSAASTAVVLVALTAASPARGHVNVTEPAGGAAVEAGTSISVEWEIEIDHEIQNWDVEFAPGEQAPWQNVALDLPPARRSYDWTVPDADCDTCRLRVTMDNVGTNYDGVATFDIVQARPADGAPDAGPERDAGGADDASEAEGGRDHDHDAAHADDTGSGAEPEPDASAGDASGAGDADGGADAAAEAEPPRETVGGSGNCTAGPGRGPPAGAALLALLGVVWRRCRIRGARARR